MLSCERSVAHRTWLAWAKVQQQAGMSHLSSEAIPQGDNSIQNHIWSSWVQVWPTYHQSTTLLVLEFWGAFADLGHAESYPFKRVRHMLWHISLGIRTVQAPLNSFREGTLHPDLYKPGPTMSYQSSRTSLMLFCSLKGLEQSKKSKLHKFTSSQNSCNLPKYSMVQWNSKLHKSNHPISMVPLRQKCLKCQSTSQRKWSVRFAFNNSWGISMLHFLEWQALHRWTMLCQGGCSWYFPLSIKHLSTLQNPLGPRSRNKCDSNSWRPATPVRVKGSVLMLALQQSQAQNLHSELFRSVCSNKASNAAPRSRRW